MANGRKGVRHQMVEEHGYDLKFAYHLIRLSLECEQILETGDLDLRRDKEIYKAIRAGAYTQDEIRAMFATKESHLTSLYENSKLPDRPDERAIRGVLINCLEQHFGSMMMYNAASTAVGGATQIFAWL